MDDPTRNDPWPAKFIVGDRVTLRRGNHEKMKIIVGPQFFAVNDDRSDQTLLRHLHEHAWRVTRVEHNYRPETETATFFD